MAVYVFNSARCQWCNFKDESKFYIGSFEYVSGATITGKITFLFLWWNYPCFHRKCLGVLFESCWRHLPVCASALLGVQSTALAHAQNSLSSLIAISHLWSKALLCWSLLGSSNLQTFSKKHPTHTQKSPWKKICGWFLEQTVEEDLPPTFHTKFFG